MRLEISQPAYATPTTPTPHDVTFSSSSPAVSKIRGQDVDGRTPGKATWIVAAAGFALSVAPTFISYKPYEFTWDDADYLVRAIAVSRAFWSGDLHVMGTSMVSWHTPAMTLLGLPWGPLRSGDAAGDCFLTLAALTAILAALCLYMLLRIGVRPVFLLMGSLCVGASLGPYQAGAHANHMHQLATRFLADNLFAWETLAAVLLIPYEARTLSTSIRSAVVRGVSCAALFSLGAFTKASFFYFIGLVFPLLLFLRLRSVGRRNTLFWIIAFTCCAAPTAIYFLRYGGSALAQGQAASFGGLADYYHVPLSRFLADTILESPGLVFSLLLLASAGIYIMIKTRPARFNPDLLALLIMLGYLFIVLAAPSKQVRYLFPAIVALPFLISVLISDREGAVPDSYARLVAGLVCVSLIGAAVPVRQRPYRQSLARAQAVLTEADRCHAKSILLATDGPTLNVFLLNLASELSSSTVSIRTLAYQGMSGVPIQDDFAAISNSDMVVFQDRPLLRPQFTNQRVPEYEQYIQRVGPELVRVAADTSVYSARCYSSATASH
jgi:hypothetical protein